MPGLTDGVGLNHTADKAQGQGDGHRKEPRQEGAELVLKSPLNVVNRAAGDGAIRMDHPGLLGQNGLGVNGGHPEKSDDPHPEDGTGPPHQDGAAGADDIACAHLGGNGGGQGLKGTQAALLPAPAHGETAENPAHALPKAADLDKAGAKGEKDPRPHQKDHQDVVGKVEVNGLHNVQQCFHGTASSRLEMKRACRSKGPAALKKRQSESFSRRTDGLRGGDARLCPFT